MWRIIRALLLFAPLANSVAISGAIPAAMAQQSHFPAPQGAGGRELRIYSSLDGALAGPLILAFQQDHPEIAVTYDDMLTGDLHARVISESDGGGGTADFTFSSAMDLQVKLANDGYGLRLDSEESAHWPDWAMWRETAFALTYEPAVFAYHRPSFRGVEPPSTRAGLIAWLLSRPEEARGRVGTYDPARSGVGYLMLARDQDIFPRIWAVAEAMGAAGARQFSTTGALLEELRRGEIVLGYNQLGSYVADYARRYPEEIGLILPRDFTVVLSRVALVPQAARNPDLGVILLNWLMSAKGQEALSEALHLPAVSLEVAARATPSGAMEDLSGLRLKPVAVGPGLLAYLDQATRAQLLAKWHRAFAPHP